MLGKGRRVRAFSRERHHGKGDDGDPQSHRAHHHTVLAPPPYSGLHQQGLDTTTPAGIVALP
jgi:hypothetical protein